MINIESPSKTVQVTDEEFEFLRSYVQTSALHYSHDSRKARRLSDRVMYRKFLDTLLPLCDKMGAERPYLEGHDHKN